MRIEKKISEFAEVITGGTPSTSNKDYWENGSIPWLNSGELNKGRISKAENFITEAGLRNSSTKMMPVDTVLIALTGATCGVTAITKIEACANQSVTGILPSKYHVPEYLYYFLKTQREVILNKAWGNAQPHISQKFVKDYVVPLLPIPDQLRIADILSKAESLITQRKESIRLLDEYLKSTFLEMFGDPVRNERGWAKSALKNFSKVRIGPFGSLLHREDYVQNGVPLVNPSHIREGKICIDPDLTISKEKMKELSAYVMLKGDVVLGRRGEIGRCAVVTNKEDGYLCGTGSIYIRPTAGLNPIFLYNIISSASMRMVLENSAKGITMKNLNSGIVENLLIPVPPLNLQTQFAQIVDKAEVLKSQYQQSLEELERLYGSLSQQAFKGELVIGNEW